MTRYETLRRQLHEFKWSTRINLDVIHEALDTHPHVAVEKLGFIRHDALRLQERLVGKQYE